MEKAMYFFANFVSFEANLQVLLWFTDLLEQKSAGGQYTGPVRREGYMLIEEGV